MVFRLSRDGTFLDFLPARGLTPYLPPSDFLGKTLPEVFPTIGAAALEKVRAALDANQEQRLEYTLTENGHRRYYEARIVACGAGEVVTLVRDLTEQRKHEESVVDIAQAISGASGGDFFRNLVVRLAQILEADIVMVGALTSGTPERIRTIAVSLDGGLADNFVYQLEGSPCDSVLTAGICSYVEGVSQRFPRDRDLVRLGIEGYVGAPLFDSQDRPLGLINVLYRASVPNVTLAESVLRIFATRASGELERMHAEQELRLSEQLNRRIVESMPGGIVQASAAGSIVVANEQARDFLCLDTKATWLTENADECPLEARPLQTCLASGVAQPPRVYGVRCPEGETRWGLFTVVPLESSDRAEPGPEGQAEPGAAEGAVLMFVDITDRRVAAQTQRELEAQMQHAQKLESLGVLAGGIAHDFNNLLTGILGNANLARKQMSARPDVAEKLERIERATERAAELTNQMLAYAGKGSFVTGPLSLNHMISELVPLLESSVSKKANLICDLDAEISEVEADRSQIEQVVMNLVTNASDALQGAEGVIRVTTRNASNEVALEVWDDGAGMDETTQSRIFDPFFTTKFAGRGLGLAAVQGIARGHGARIRVESSPGRGSRFTMYFPASKGRGRPDEMPARAEDTTRRSGTVVVIDDDETVREVAKAALEGAGYHVVLASDGVAGLELVDGLLKVDVVVLDLSMPRLSGEETFARIRKLCPALPVLLTSGYPRQDVFTRIAGKSVAGFIHKPFRAAELVEKVGLAAAGKPLSRQA